MALSCLAPVVAVALLPGDWRLLAVPLALLAGTTVERYRQGGRERPLSLTATPREWRRSIAAVGWPYALAGVAATAVAAALLGLPAPRDQPPEADAGGVARSSRSAAIPGLPEVKRIRYPPGRSIRAPGASFRVSLPAREPWARAIRSRDAGRRATWILVGIDARNLHRRRFNPNALAYRLADAGGNRYAPVVGGGTGPGSLRRTGFLPPGKRAQARLGFRVPRSARGLALVFEPVPDGSLQVEVPLARGRSG